MRTMAGMLGMILFAAAIVAGSFGILRQYRGNNLVSEPISGKQAGYGAGFRHPNGQSLHVGRTATAGGVKWTVNSVLRTDQLHQFTEPPTVQKGDFLVVNFTARNASDYPVTLDFHSMILRNSKGQSNIPAADLNTEYVAPPKDILFNKYGLLHPGETRKGRVNFDLKAFGSHPYPHGPTASKPPSLSEIKIRVGDPATSVKYITLKP